MKDFTLNNIELPLPELPHYVLTIDEYLDHGIDLDHDGDVDEFDFEMYLTKESHHDCYTNIT